MSIALMTETWALDLPDSQKLVLLALADAANDEGHCWPSMATLSKKCSKGERTVQGVIKALEQAGHITRRENPGKGCDYLIHPRSDCAPQKPHPRSERRQPPQRLRPTPAATADKPKEKHQEPKNEVKASAHRFPANWQPAPLPVSVQALVDLWPPGRLDREVEQFRDYWLDRTEKRPGWDRTFHNRIRDIHDRVLRETRNDRSPANQRSPSGNQADNRTPFQRVCDERIFGSSPGVAG